MKASELRLGNIVADESGFIMYVVGIYQDIVYLDFKGNEGDVREVSEKDLKPVPLTDSLFLEVGFKCPYGIINSCNTRFVEFYSIVYKYETNFPEYAVPIKIHKRIESAIKGNGEERYIYNYRIGENTELKYLHQLQNLYFVLAEKELDVNIEKIRAITTHRNLCPEYKKGILRECGNYFHRHECKTNTCDMNCEYMKNFLEKI